MISISKRSLLIIIITISFHNCRRQTTQEIKIKINGLTNSKVILGYYYNNRMKPKDTISIDNNGFGFINTNTKLEEGIYFLYFPNKTYLNFLISSDQNFLIRVSYHDPAYSQEISGSNESKLYADYTKYIIKKQNELRHLLSSQISSNIKKKIEIIQKEILAKTNELTETHSGTLLAKMLTLANIVHSYNLNAGNDTINDATKNKNNKEHYFDNIDFNDKQLLYSPYYKQVLDIYFSKITYKNYKYLIDSSNRLIDGSTNKEVKKYLIKYFFNLASTSHAPGSDNFLTNIAEKYYLTGEAYWVDSIFMKKLEYKINVLKNCLLGETAPDLLLESYNGQYFKLSEEKSTMTMLIFWDPNCGHCKSGIPQIKNNIWDNFKYKGIKIFAVYTQKEKEPWINFIEYHDLYEWINVYDPYYSSNFWNLYNIHSTPTIYVLNRENIIIYKMYGDNFNFNELYFFVQEYLSNH